MRPASFEWLPSFCKEVFHNEIAQYQFISFNEDEFGIAFENKFIYWGLYMDDVYVVRCSFHFEKTNPIRNIDITQILEHESTEIKEYFYNRMQEIFSGEYWKHADEIIKSQILLFHEIIKSHFLHFFEGKIPVYWEQAINEPRHDYYKMFKDE